MTACCEVGDEPWWFDVNGERRAFLPMCGLPSDHDGECDWMAGPPVPRRSSDNCPECHHQRYRHGGPRGCTAHSRTMPLCGCSLPADFATVLEDEVDVTGPLHFRS